MSTYILMKILESAPSRYDQGIRILTFGKVDAVYDRLTTYIKNGQRVLDIGCGTGALSLRAARNGASVKAIDINPRMLEIARQRAKNYQLSSEIEFVEIGVAELGNEPDDCFDAVISGLCFSELTPDELNFTLMHLNRILKPGGLLLVADEVNPETVLNKTLVWMIRIPLLAITYLLTQTTTRPTKDLTQKITDSGFIIQSFRTTKLKNFIEIVAKKF